MESVKHVEYEKQAVVFGLNGRTEEQILDAVKMGYTVFDGGDSYNGAGGVNTYSYLRKALTSQKVTDYQFIYKIANNYNEAGLEDHIKMIKSAFDKPLYCVLIHDRSHIAKYGKCLQKLKTEKLVKNIGVSNITKEDFEVDFVKNADCLELNALALLDQSYLDGILGLTAKKVFIYGLAGASRQNLDEYYKLVARELKEYDETEKCINSINRSHLRHLFKIFSNIIQSAMPIFSSSNKEHMQENIVWEIPERNFSEMDRKYLLNFETVYNYFQTPNRTTCMTSECPEYLKDIISKMLGEYEKKYNPQIDTDFKKEQVTTEIEKWITQIKKDKSLFKEEHLEVFYLYKENHCCYTIKTLIEMLFSTEGNCPRVTAINVFSNIMAAI